MTTQVDRKGKNKHPNPGVSNLRAEKKRARDRQAQKSVRERSKARIAQLEQHIQSLTSGDKQGEITRLQRLLAHLQNENSQLRSDLAKIGSMIDHAVLISEPGSDSEAEVTPGRHSAKGGSCSSSISGHSSPLASGTLYEDAVALIVPDQYQKAELIPSHTSMLRKTVTRKDMAAEPGSPDEAAAQFSPVNDIGTGKWVGLEDLFDIDSDIWLEQAQLDPAIFREWHSPSPLDLRVPSNLLESGIVPDDEKWAFANGAILRALESVRNQSSSTRGLDLQVPFRAVLWGSDTVIREAQHPLWIALRQIDKQIFGTWTSKAQRIALLHLIHVSIECRENPTPENGARVPSFLRPRPSQERIQHPPVIDTMIWPGLRDILVFEHKRYSATGAFSAAYVQYFHFHWPYPDREILKYSPLKKDYTISKRFLEYVNDFANWNMDPKFFENYPEMQPGFAP